MRVAVVGAGINGIMSAWALADDGHRVTLLERGVPMDATSSASSKLLHGGLRYLEHGDVRLVREGLRERSWWLKSAPELTRTIALLLPVYRHAPRGRFTLKLGLLAYDFLAGRRGLGRHRWLDASALRNAAPQLRREGLIGAYRYFDGQMDDRALGLWALARAQAAGVALRVQQAVERVDVDGGVTIAGTREAFDCVVNVAGPWAADLLARSGVPSKQRLELVRGSHLRVARRLSHGLLLQSPDDGRVCFVLPWQGQTLIGTTEVRQTLDEPIACSAAEQRYLVSLWNAYLTPALNVADITGEFAGVRPLVAGDHGDLGSVSRDYAIERAGRLVTVFGGKWTTARALGRQVAGVVAG